MGPGLIEKCGCLSMSSEAHRLRSDVTLQLPRWLTADARRWTFEPGEPASAMALAIELARQNVEHQTGGPFGALVVSLASGEVVSAAVNCVEAQSCSCAHAEIMALSLAQQRYAQWNLATTPHAPLTLVTSAEPCAMCLGAIPWSGVQHVICGATKADVEAAGFDEGARSSLWVDELNERGIGVEVACLRAQAAQVLMAYAQSGQTIYNP